jgi:hypothetical protein
MKLRIKGNSIRLRLLRSEVERFAAAGQISETVEFGPGPTSFFRYTLLISPDVKTTSAEFRGNEIAIMVPEATARMWIKSDMVGFDIAQPIGNGDTLSILVEKDFVCLDRPNDPDREDAFPNPSSECKTDVDGIPIDTREQEDRRKA